MTDEQLSQEQEDFIGPGKLLQRARSQAGLSVEQIAGKLNLKPQNILDIESEQFDDRISVTFNRGYLKAYAKQVGVNEGMVLEAFESLNACSKEPAKLQSFSRRVANQASDDRLMLVSYAILIVILGLFVAWWWQQDSDLGMTGLPEIPALTSTDVNNTQSPAERATDAVKTESAEAPPETSQYTEESVLVEEQMAQEVVGQSQSETVGEQVDTAAQAEEVERLNRESQDLNAAQENLTQAQATDAASTNSIAETPIAEDQAAVVVQSTDTPAADTQNVTTGAETAETNEEVAQPVTGDPVELVFEFSDDCWMQLTDATGEAIAYGVKAKGRVMTVSGIPPFEVILGAPAVVNINYAGEAINMAQFPNNRTARFNLPLSEEGDQ